MKCVHCGNIVPDDSEFCPYCGGKIEKPVPAIDPVQEKPPQSSNSVTLNDSQAERDRVTQSQRYFDTDYGYSPENPIVTSSIPVIGYYLAALRTPDGKPFTWERMAKQGDSQIDGYCLYLDGAPYKSIYFNSTGNDSEYIPAGLEKNADAFEAARAGITLEELLARRDAEKKKSEQKRAARKRIVKGCVLCLLLIAIAICGYFGFIYGYPYLQYQNAIKKIDQNPAVSLETFEKLGAYKNSAELVKWAHYYRMQELVKQGQYKDALEEYGFFCDSKDSTEGSNSLKTITDKDGTIVFNAGEVNYYIKELKRTCYIEIAKTLISEKKYEEATETLLSLPSELREEMLAECKYNLFLKYYSEKNWVKAFENMSALGSLKNAGKNYDISLQRYDVLFNYAKECIKENTEYSLSRAAGTAKTLEIEYGALEAIETLKQEIEDAKTELRYVTAIDLSKARNYIEAANTFSIIGDYKDSEELRLEAMYQYVHTTTRPKALWFNISGTTIQSYYAFAKELAERNYLDSKQFYEELAKWKVTTILNNSQDDGTTEMYSVSKYDDCCVHVTVSGGLPGESVRLKYVFTMSDGGTVSGKWDWEMHDGSEATAWCYYEQPQYAPSGTCKVRIYNIATGKLMAEDSIRITN